MQNSLCHTFIVVRVHSFIIVGNVGTWDKRDGVCPEDFIFLAYDEKQQVYASKKGG